LGWLNSDIGRFKLKWPQDWKTDRFTPHQPHSLTISAYVPDTVIIVGNKRVELKHGMKIELYYQNNSPRVLDSRKALSIPGKSIELVEYLSLSGSKAKCDCGIYLDKAVLGQMILSCHFATEDRQCLLSCRSDRQHFNSYRRMFEEIAQSFEFY
jgi:hypothetical protein